MITSRIKRTKIAPVLVNPGYPYPPLTSSLMFIPLSNVFAVLEYIVLYVRID